MTIMQRNIFVCFMGFAILSIFNVNHSFASETKSVKEHVSSTQNK